MSDEERARLLRKVAALVVTVVVTVVVLILTVWWTSSQGRTEVVGAQRTDCVQRAETNRRAAQVWIGEAMAWWRAADARRADGQEDVAAVYTATADRDWDYALRQLHLAHRDCVSDFPDPGPFAFR